MTKTEIYELLNKYGITLSFISEYYYQPHRFYHNYTHIMKMINEADDKKILSVELFLAIIFHDIIYDPKANDNEEKSAKLFIDMFGKNGNEEIIQAILDTKTHIPTNELSKHLCELDLSILNGTITDFIEFENNIFKEYQFVDYSIYKEKRIEVLTKLNVKKEFIDYVKYRPMPKIGIYAGSFNPFHKGHYDILQKAEKIFDKVIIARGINPEKNNEILPLPEILKYRQIENYNGLLTDFIDKLDYNTTLIRGLRNATDLQYEITQYRFLQEFKNDINIVSIFCDKEYEHISSSSIRMLKKYNKDESYIL